MSHSSVAFFGIMRSASSLAGLTPKCSGWCVGSSGCAHMSFSLAMNHPYFLVFILTDGESFFWTICLGVGCVEVGRLLLPCLCSVQSSAFLPLLCWHGPDETCSALVCVSPVCAVSGKPVEHFSCPFEWCWLCRLYSYFCNVTLVYSTSY